MGRSSKLEVDRRPAKSTVPASPPPQPATVAPLGPIDKRTWAILALILLAGAAIRVAYLQEVRHAPDYAAPLADAKFHDYWARAIVTGEWVPPPNTDDPRIREVPYTRPPGYTWFLAATYATFGPGYLWPRAVQMGLGLLTAGLGFMLGRLVFSPRAGLCLAAIIASFWVFVHYEGELQEPAVLSVLGMGLALSLCAWCRRPVVWLACCAGVLAGLFAITRSNILLFVPVAALWMLWCARRRDDVRMPLLHAALFVLASMMVVAPVTLRNLRVGRELVVVACNGPINFYIGNNPASDGATFTLPTLRELTGLSTWGWFSYDRVVHGLEARTGRTMSYGDASRFFTARAWEFIRANPGRFAELCLKRAWLFWGPEEIANNKVERLERANSAILRWLPNYSLLLALTLVGAIEWLLTRQRNAAITPPRQAESVVIIALFIAMYFLSFVPFLVATRFRAPLLPIVFIFAAFLLARAIEWIVAREWRALLGSGAVVAALTAILMFIAAASHIDLRDVPGWHVDRGVAFATIGRHDEAIEEYRRAVAFNRQFVAAYTAWFESAIARGDVSEAARVAEELRLNRPDRVDVARHMTERLRSLGR